MLTEIADDEVHGEALVLVGEDRGGLAQELVAHVEGDVAGQDAELLERPQKHPGLLARAGAELDECVGLRQLGDGRGVRLQQGPLGPGGVVLG